MTRINTIDPQDLTNEWLLAEWRELPRIINELVKHPKRFNLKSIPAEYTLNKGHVTFFRNKLLYLQKRHTDLIAEMLERGINFDKSVVIDLTQLAPHIKMFGCKDWVPVKRDHAILVERLDERFRLRKKGYSITIGGVKSKIDCDESYNRYKDLFLNKYVD